MSAARKLRRRTGAGRKRHIQRVTRASLDHALTEHVRHHTMTFRCPSEECAPPEPFTFTRYDHGTLLFQCYKCHVDLPMRVAVAPVGEQHLPHAAPLARPELDQMGCGDPTCNHGKGCTPVLLSRCHPEAPGVATYHHGHVAIACSVCQLFIAAVQVG